MYVGIYYSTMSIAKHMPFDSTTDTHTYTCSCMYNLISTSKTHLTNEITALIHIQWQKNVLIDAATRYAHDYIPIPKSDLSLLTRFRLRNGPQLDNYLMDSWT